MRASLVRMSRYDRRTLMRKEMRGQNDEWYHRECRQREAPVHRHHQRRDRQQREEVAKSRDHPRSEQLVQCLDVGRDARHQPADRIAIEEGDRQPLHVGENASPEVAHHALPEKTSGDGLAILGAERQQKRAGEEGKASRLIAPALPAGMATSMTWRVNSGPTSWSKPSTIRSDTAAPTSPPYGRT